MSLAQRIAALVRGNPGQMRSEEYAAVAESLLATNPTYALVFGVGRDSELWASLMRPGAVLVFVEDCWKWAADAPGPVVMTQYKGTVATWKTQSSLGAFDAMPLLARMPWDWVLVDGPMGWRDTDPGRLGPIKLASMANAVVIVHDCHRPLEREVCDLYLPRPFRAVHHLRIYDRPLPQE